MKILPKLYVNANNLVDCFLSKEQKTNKYFKIHDYPQINAIADDLYGMREAIANYAKKHMVRIDVYDAKTPVKENGIEYLANDKFGKDKINIVVTNKLTKKTKHILTEAILDKIYPQKSIVRGQKGFRSDDKPVVVQSEDTCRRHIFRAIQELTNTVAQHH